MKYRNLEVFRTVMRAGSLTGAAHLLGMTQPGVSKLVAQTEAQCGFALFERLHNRITPTARALRLFDEAEKLFIGMENIEKLVERLRNDGSSRLIVAAVPVVAQEIFPAAAKAWQGEYEAQISVTMRDAGGVLAMVTSRNADLGFTMSFRRVPGVHSQLIGRSRVMCAMAADHPLARLSEIAPQDLEGVETIAISRHEGQQLKIDAILSEAGVRPREVADVPLILGAAAMAHAGIGVTFADHFSAQPWLGRGLVLRPFTPQIRFEYHAVWTEGGGRRVEVQSLIGQMHKTFRALSRRAVP